MIFDHVHDGSPPESINIFLIQIRAKLNKNAIANRTYYAKQIQ